MVGGGQVVGVGVGEKSESRRVGRSACWQVGKSASR